MRTWLIVFFLGASAGCGSSASDPRARARTDPGTTASEPGAISASPGGLGVRIAGEPDTHTRHVAVRVENRSEEPVEMRARLALERRARDGSWEDARARIELRDGCSARAPECISLAPGAVFIAPDWLGTRGGDQCRCTRCVPAPAGTYRFVAERCHGTGKAEGEPFDLP